MKTLFKLVLTTLAVLALTIPAAADGLRGNIPFNFTVAGREYPAGDYTVTMDGYAKQVILNGEGAQRGFVPYIVCKEIGAASARTSLVFHKYGEKYFLHEVNLSSTGIDVATSKEEKWATRASNRTGAPRMALVRVALH